MQPYYFQFRICFVVFGFTFASPAGAQQNQAEFASAEKLFQAGKFAEAGKIYSALVTQMPKHYRAMSRLGQIALYSNRLAEAEKWFKKTEELRPDAGVVKFHLAEVYYRQDDFARAAPLVRFIGQEAKAKKLESFGENRPYEIEQKADRISIKFVMTDPLPVLRVRVNGSPEANFFLDTGASEVVLDSDFARQVGAQTFGAETGRFAGGKEAAYQHGRIESLALGDLVIKNLPVHILNTRQFSRPIFGGTQIDGIIGTVLLYHFLATIDYRRGELVLRPNTEAMQQQLATRAKIDRAAAVPFWLAGDHYIVSWGRVEQSEPVLLFVDTGLAGGGVTLAESVIREARIKLLEDQASEGLGAGGKVRVVPFSVQELSLGDIKQRNVRGLFTGAFPLENALGFRIGGLISHGFFRPFALTLDFQTMRLLLTRNP